MKYVALLRGINVGGNALIKMADLKETVSACGYQNVITYINSGNVVFDSDEKYTDTMVIKLETDLSKRFGFDLKVVLRSQTQMKKILDDVPPDWKKKTDIRCYIAFIKEPITEKEVLKEITLKEGVDFVKAGIGVIYMTTIKSGLMKSGFTKLIGKKIYKELTMRNYNTSQKILALME